MVVIYCHPFGYKCHTLSVYIRCIVFPDLFSRIKIPSKDLVALLFRTRSIFLGSRPRDGTLFYELCDTNCLLITDWGLLDVVFSVCLRYYCCYLLYFYCYCRRSIGNERNWDAREVNVQRYYPKYCAVLQDRITEAAMTTRSLTHLSDFVVDDQAQAAFRVFFFATPREGRATALLRSGVKETRNSHVFIVIRSVCLSFRLLFFPFFFLNDSYSYADTRKIEEI